MKKLAQVAFVMLLCISWATAQEAKKTTASYEPAVVIQAPPTPSPSPSATPTPEVVEKFIYVPSYIPAQIQKEVQATQQIQVQSATVPKMLADEAKRLLSAQQLQSGMQKDGSIASAVSTPEGGCGFNAPPLVLEINKNHFSRDETMQARLRVVSRMHSGQVYWFWVNIDSSPAPQFRFGNLGTKAFVPGETVSVKNYTWDGTEEEGTYVYGVFVVDNNGQITTEAVTNFMYGAGNPQTGYVRIDSSESVGGGWVHLRGNFFFSNFDPRFHQYVSAGGQIFNVAFSTNTDAWVYVPLMSGIYDLTWVAWYEGNQSYDSVTTPGVLKVFNSSFSGGKG